MAAVEPTCTTRPSMLIVRPRLLKSWCGSLHAPITKPLDEALSAITSGRLNLKSW